MRNRAKCKLCGDIIESFHPTDERGCKCGEIAVMGGDALRTWAADYANFLRVDDLGNEIIVEYREGKDKPNEDSSNDKPPEQVTCNDLIEELEYLIKNIENSPEHVKMSPINHYDLVSLMLVLKAIFKKGGFCGR